MTRPGPSAWRRRADVVLALALVVWGLVLATNASRDTGLTLPGASRGLQLALGAALAALGSAWPWLSRRR